MSHHSPITSLTLRSELKRGILERGCIDKTLLRSLAPNMSDVRFAMEITRARKELESEGIFLKPVPGHKGVLRIASVEDVIDKVMNKSRLKIIKSVRGRVVLLRNAQKHRELDETSRLRLNAEEITASRFAVTAERMLLRHVRSRPDGLE